MLTKKIVKDSGHLKSGRYYLPKIPLLTDEGNKSGLLWKLAVKASTDPCGASYQHCYSETPMIRYRSKSIDDFCSLKFQYRDNSTLFMKSGYPVGFKIAIDMDIDWFDSPSEIDKAIVEIASSSEHEKEWSTLTIPSPHHYLKHELFFMGHLDNDNILQDIDTVLHPLTPQVTDDLTDSFGNLGKAKSPKKVIAEKLVVIMPEHQAVTPMDIEKMTEVSKDTKVNPKSSVSKTKTSDDHERDIKINIIDDLQLDS